MNFSDPEWDQDPLGSVDYCKSRLISDSFKSTDLGKDLYSSGFTQGCKDAEESHGSGASWEFFTDPGPETDSASNVVIKNLNYF